MSELFHRSDIMQGLVFGAPTQCGIVNENGELCESCPIWKNRFGRFVCKKHLPPDEFDLFCAICLEDCTFETLFRTKCKHSFHKECIYQWISTKNKTCPTCRSTVVSFLTPTRVKMTPLQKLQTSERILQNDDIPLHTRRIILKKMRNYRYDLMKKTLPDDLVDVVGTIHRAYDKTLIVIPYTLEIFRDFKTWYPNPDNFNSIEDLVYFYR